MYSGVLCRLSFEPLLLSRFLHYGMRAHLPPCIRISHFLLFRLETGLGILLLHPRIKKNVMMSVTSLGALIYLIFLFSQSFLFSHLRDRCERGEDGRNKTAGLDLCSLCILYQRVWSRLRRLGYDMGGMEGTGR